MKKTLCYLFSFSFLKYLVQLNNTNKQLTLDVQNWNLWIFLVFFNAETSQVLYFIHFHIYSILFT